MEGVEIRHWARLGAALREARQRSSWTQVELAARAQVSRSWLARVEAGHRGAELEPLLRLFEALQLRWLITQAPEPEDRLDDVSAARALASQQRRQSWAAAGEAQVRIGGTGGSSAQP